MAKGLWFLLTCWILAVFTEKNVWQLSLEGVYGETLVNGEMISSSDKQNDCEREEWKGVASYEKRRIIKSSDLLL